MKACVDCRWCEKQEYYWCKRQLKDLSPVTGRIQTIEILCEIERASGYDYASKRCGPDAKFFEIRPPIVVVPTRISRWRVLWKLLTSSMEELYETNSSRNRT